MSNGRFLKRTVITLLVVMAITGCNKNKDKETNIEPSTFETITTQQTETSGEEPSTTETETQTEQGEISDTTPVENDFPSLSSETSLIPEGKTVRSFLTGEWVNDTIAYRRPLAVMINNIQGGLPQRGISKADIIFEGQCEGKITRLMAVFQDYDEVDSIGSIRSCRDYFPFLAAECDAAYYHFGQSDFALQFLDDPELRTFNGMLGRYGYERRQDRVSPHNVFSTPEQLVTAMVNRNVTTYLDEGFVAPFVFTESDTPISCPDGEKCYTLKTGYSYNEAYFVYNEEDGLYYRYEYGAPQIDEMTGEQLAVKNIFMKLVPGEEYWNHSPLYLLTGEGLGLLVTNGTAQWCVWTKDVDGVNTNLGCEYTYGYGPNTIKYFGGDEVVFNQGKTWVCIFEQEDQSMIEILDK